MTRPATRTPPSRSARRAADELSETSIEMKLLRSSVAAISAIGCLACMASADVIAGWSSNASIWAYSGTFGTGFFNQTLYSSPHSYISDAAVGGTGWGEADFWGAGVPGVRNGVDYWSMLGAGGYARSDSQFGSSYSKVDLWFTLDTLGEFSISSTGAGGHVQIDGVASVTGTQSTNGWFGPGTYHLYAIAECNDTNNRDWSTFSFTVPSPGPLSLALLGVGLLCPRRRRAAH